MEDIKKCIAKNITELRLLNDMTQTQLGQKLNYSDKTVSKWERGESTPDIEVLVALSELFGVTVDSLVSNDSISDKTGISQKRQKSYNRRAIMVIIDCSVMLVALFAFVITSLIIRRSAFQILYLVYAVPVIFIIKIILNSVWFNPRRNYYIVSALIWATLASIYITFWYFNINVSLIFLLGIVGQMIVVICSFISRPINKKRKKSL